MDLGTGGSAIASASTTRPTDSLGSITTDSTVVRDSSLTTAAASSSTPQSDQQSAPTFVQLELTEGDEQQILSRTDRLAHLLWFESTSTAQLAQMAEAEMLITSDYAAELADPDQAIGPASPDELRLLAVAIPFVDVDFVVTEVTLEVISSGIQQKRYFELIDSSHGWQIRSAQ